MKKLLTTFALITFVIGLQQTASAARTIDCKIVSSQGNTVTMTCGKKAKKLKSGDQVKVTKETEGC